MCHAQVAEFCSCFVMADSSQRGREDGARAHDAQGSALRNSVGDAAEAQQEAEQDADDLAATQEITSEHPSEPVPLTKSVGTELGPSEGQGHPSWADLPEEVLRIVFAALEGSRAGSAGAGAARATCRRWWSILTPARVSLYPRSRGGGLPFHWTSRFPGLRTLDLGRCLNADDTWLAALTSLSSLTSLSVRGSERVTWIGIQHLVRSNLASILVHMDLSECRRVNDKASGDLCRLSSLGSLSLGQCRGISDASVADLAALPALTHLDLSVCPKVTDSSLEALSCSASRLVSLLLTNCRGVTDEGAGRLGALPALTHLDVSGCSIHGSALELLPPSLTSLHLRGLNSVGDSSVALLRSARHLRVLDLTHCAVTDAGMELLAAGFTGLCDLSLAQCCHITDSGLLCLAPLRLQGLNVSFCSISDECVQCLVSAQSCLRRLSLRGCRAVADSCLSALARASSDLEDLNLGSCDRVTDTGLRALHGLASLTSLNLQFCDRLTDAGIAELMEALPLLVHLNTDRTCDNNLMRNTGNRAFLR